MTHSRSLGCLLMTFLITSASVRADAWEGHPAETETATTLTLQSAIRAALDANLYLQVAALNPEIARSRIVSEEATFDPELFATGRVSQSEQNTTFSETEGTSSDNRSWSVGSRKRFSYGTSVTVQTNLDRRNSNAGVFTSNLSQDADLSLSVRQPLLRGFGRENNLAGVEAARSGEDAAMETFRDTLLEILSGTERAYWEVSRLQDQLRLNQSSLKVADALLTEARERERLGIATRIEVLQAEAAKAERAEAIILTRQQLGDAYDALLLRMGVLPEDMPMETDNSLPAVRNLQDEEPAIPPFRDVLEMALANDPGLREQEARISEQEWNRIRASGNTRANLDLILSGAYLGIDDRDARTAYENALDREGHAWSVGMEFSLPWNLRAEKAALTIAEKQVQQEELRYAALKQELVVDVRRAWRNLEALRQSIDAARLTVGLQEATFEQEKGKYEEGLSVFRDVLEVQSDLDQARVRLLQAKFSGISAEIELSRLTGKILERYGIDPDAVSNLIR